MRLRFWLDRLFTSTFSLESCRGSAHSRSEEPKVHDTTREVISKKKSNRLTLTPDTPIASNADPLADPVGDGAQLAALDAPMVMVLPLMLEVVALAAHQRGHDDPFGDGRAVDARRRRDRYIAVRHDRVVHPVVDPRGEQVDQFQAVK